MSTIKIGSSVFYIVHTPQNLSDSMNECKSQKSEISKFSLLQTKATYNMLAHNITETNLFKYRVARNGEPDDCFTIVNFLSVFPELETFTLCNNGQKFPTICYKQGNDTSYIESSSPAHLSLSTAEVVLLVLGVCFIATIICCLFRSMMYPNINESSEAGSMQMNTIKEDVKTVGFFKNIYKPKSNYFTKTFKLHIKAFAINFKLTYYLII